MSAVQGAEPSLANRKLFGSRISFPVNDNDSLKKHFIVVIHFLSFLCTIGSIHGLLESMLPWFKAVVVAQGEVSCTLGCLVAIKGNPLENNQNKV